jgi:hypothetical protein
MATQNSLLESIVRDQASVIEGQRLTNELLTEEIKRLTLNK